MSGKGNAFRSECTHAPMPLELGNVINEAIKFDIFQPILLLLIIIIITKIINNSIIIQPFYSLKSKRVNFPHK